MFDAGPPGPEILDPIVRAALEEDHAFDDRSTAPLLPGRDTWRGRVLGREAGVLAGVDVFRRVFEMLAEGAEVTVTGGRDGDSFAAADTVLEIEGPGRILLSGERTALNFLQRLSGVATATRRAVRAAAGRFAVCDTRKTTPGMRALEKWAVVIGGGRSHRWSLGDMVMLKENHLALGGGVTAAVEAIRADPESARLPITVEVTSEAQASEAAALGVDRLLLDNMTIDEMARVSASLGPLDRRPELEASGGIRPEDVGRIADAGVDLVSLGSLTHSVRAIDFSFRIVPPGDETRFPE
jgi:nicotinate-nucleotide pyrophosphorylase (carboxylating)